MGRHEGLRISTGLHGLLLLGSLCVSTAALGGAAAPAAPGAAAVAYRAVAGKSTLDFVGVQAGAPFKAAFHRFSAAILFAPQALAQSHLDVLIDMNSADSADKDRDGTMRGADIFDVTRWPTAHYATRSIVKTGAGYSAIGSLTLRGVTKDVPITFQFALTPGGAKLTGNAALKRLDFGVGQGDWRNTQWVGNDVKIAFSLVLMPKQRP